MPKEQFREADVNKKMYVEMVVNLKEVLKMLLINIFCIET